MPQRVADLPECGPDDLDVSAAWDLIDGALRGQIVVQNIGNRTCRLSGKPTLIPLGLDGQPVPARFIISLELRVPPVVLPLGARAAAALGWSGWCGNPASGDARISCGSETKIVSVSGPRQPECPENGGPTNLSSSWFNLQ